MLKYILASSTYFSKKKKQNKYLLEMISQTAVLLLKIKNTFDNKCLITGYRQ